MEGWTDGWMEGRTNRPSFIRPFRLRLGVQKVISITMAAAQAAENHGDE